MDFHNLLLMAPTKTFYFFRAVFFLVVLFLVVLFLTPAFVEVFFRPPKALSKLDAYPGVEPTRRIVTASFPYNISLVIEISINEYCMNNGRRQVIEALPCQFFFVLGIVHAKPVSCI